MSEQELQAMAVQQYRQFLSSNRVVSPSADRDAEMVRRVGQRLANAITQYYSSERLTEVLEGYKWEFNLVNDKEANAWCYARRKNCCLYRLFPITQNEAALANVLGHEDFACNFSAW